MNFLNFFRGMTEPVASEKKKKKKPKDKKKRKSLAVTEYVDDGKIRLNLGCGDKKLQGFINVDAAPSRKGVIPDVIADIRHLNFQTDSVDEILSVHVIEHFYIWEAELLLDEWIRVLKQGGKLILECPNILYAAETLLKNPEEYSLPGKEGQMTMWSLYGDPAWKDPLMCHKWGYTPWSLKKLLLSRGLHEVQQEPAQFKKREPRDMRVTGIK